MVNKYSNKAFTLLEMTIVVIIATILLTYAVPVMYRSYLNKSGTKTALETQVIQDAARKYYLQNGVWPSSVNTAPNDLESTGYLPPTWNGINTYGYPYLTSSTVNTFTVATTVHDGAQYVAASNLPNSQISGISITSTILKPGSNVNTVSLYTGTIGDGGTIPLPTGFTDSQCTWFVAGSTDETYDSSGNGGCENDEYIETHISTRSVSTYTHGDCRRSYVSNNVNYLGICQTA